MNSDVTARIDQARGTTLGFVPDELNRMKERTITLPVAAGGEVSHEHNGDDEMSWPGGEHGFGGALGCRAKLLRLFGDSPDGDIGDQRNVEDVFVVALGPGDVKQSPSSGEHCEIRMRYLEGAPVGGMNGEGLEGCASE